tara:strand:+ start:224 stop:1417 length:1194 start_codon:yes stop_codon:yes gene_type:complete
MKRLEDYKWMCPQPFANVSTDPYGIWQPCCTAQFDERLSSDEDWEKLLTKKDLKNVRTDSFTDYYRSDYMTKVRDAFRKGDKNFLSDMCKQCIKSEEYGLQSSRTVSLEKFFNQYKHKKEELERIIDEDCEPTFFESPILISLGGNLCNLKCGMCHDSVSSARKAESIKLGEIEKSSALLVPEHCDEFYKDLDFIINNSLEFELPQAEPLLVEYNYEILKRLKEGCRLKMVTNGTINTDRFISLAKHLDATVNISIEGGKDVNTYIRYPSKWETIIENYDKLDKHFDVSFMSTINSLNIGKFTQLKKDIGHRKWNQGSVIVNNRPYTLSAIPDDVKEIYLNDCFEFGMIGLINYLEDSVYDEKVMTELMQHCKRRDTLRGTYLPDVFPEWKKYYEKT